MGNSGDSKISLLNAVSIGIGGMVGGGIFAVLGLAVSLARGGTPLAFLFAGLIALVTSYSYAKLSSKYPDDGGTVAFIDLQFGEGVLGGGINNLLWISYIVMISLYASAFGSYGARLISLTGQEPTDAALFQSGIIAVALLINYFSVRLVSGIESVSVLVKLSILIGFVFMGAYGFTSAPETLSQLRPGNWQSPFLLLTGGMVIFVAYEGFELIANSISDLRNPGKNTEKAYYWAVGFVICLYILIAVVTVGSLPFGKIAEAQDYVLAEVARPMLGKAGFTIIGITALISTFSAINATVLGSGRVNYDISKENELPHYFTRSLWGKPVGYLATAALSLVLVNLFNLQSISTAGSAGFLLIFTAVNYVGFRKYDALGSRRWLHMLGAVLSALAFLALIIQQFTSNPTGALVALGIISFCFLLEWGYQRSGAGG